MKKLVKILGIAAGVLVLLLIMGLIYFNSAFPKTSAPENVKLVATPEKIARGEYLANHVAMCMDCHSNRDWTRFSGPIKDGSLGRGGDKFDEAIGFPGTIYPRNITPDKETGIGNWTDGEIIRAITMGVNKNNEALFPMMPYFNFNKMSREDLEAIVVYLKSIEPIKNYVPQTELNFPLNFIVKTLPLQTYNAPEPVDKKNPVEYGKYLVTIAGCEDCHTQSKEGEPLPGMNFAGGMEVTLPPGTLRTANITPDMETGIGTWSKEMFIGRFKSFDSDSAKYIPANLFKEYNSIMPWTLYAGMTKEDLSAIYDYLRTVKPVKNKVIKFSPVNQQFANKK